MVCRYRHRPSGAIVTANKALPASEWEEIAETADGHAAAPEAADEQEKPVAKPRRTPGARKTASPRG